MLDTTPITAQITKLIAAGVPEGEIVTRVLQQFPHLTVAELSTALQIATAAAERQAIRRHWWNLPICRAAGRRLKDYIARGGRH